MYHVTMIHTKSYSSPLLNVCVINWISFSCKIAIYGRLTDGLAPVYPSHTPQFGNHWFRSFGPRIRGVFNVSTVGANTDGPLNMRAPNNELRQKNLQVINYQFSSQN